ncbi:hypothetical protein [Treponema sp.]|uniref:hypothetical protein n=1 Tax=Treponema sp. TaxID=166 RepID=UPI00298E34E9|nr:hypothetical protein [Treponema sp.]MCQ2242069.1 hypothetical protein [Treponema sp.]
MGKNDTRNAIASLILTLAVGCMLAVSGIYALQGKAAGDLAVKGLKAIFDGNVESIVITIFGVVELLAGVFIVLKCFIGDRMGSFGNIISLVVVIVWVVVIILADIITGIGKPNFLAWLLQFSKDLIIFGAIWVCCR